MRWVMAVLLLTVTPALAGDFSINATEIAKIMINNTVEQLRISQSIFRIIDLSESQLPDIYQNLWGIIYGIMVLQNVNNQITNLVFDAMNNESYTADMSYYGYGQMKLYDVVGDSVNMLGASSDEVFGDPQGTKGVARIMYSEYYVLKDPNNEFEYDYLGAYATELVKTYYIATRIFIKLADAIDKAFT
ncbi:MAG: hypothetical protein QXP46_03010 [Archaeoglobaceae archaeon]